MERRLSQHELPIEVASVLKAEFDSIRCHDDSSSELGSPPDLSTVLASMYDSRLSAICLSGGGIRSATFALGLLQSLAKRRLLSKFEYLSTVSGGGYIGSWLSAWVRTEQVNAFERAAISVEYENLTASKAIAKHFSSDGSESNSFTFLKYQELKYGFNPELRRKADISVDALVLPIEKNGIYEETIALPASKKEVILKNEFSVVSNAPAAIPIEEESNKLVQNSGPTEKELIPETILDLEFAETNKATKTIDTAAVDRRVAELQAEFDETRKVRDYGIRSVEQKLAQGLNKNSDSPNPEPGQIKHLRQYSNYMTPSVGITSADSWAFIGLYLRNLFVNWLIFMPLLAGVLLIPRFLYSLIREATDLLNMACSAANSVAVQHSNESYFLAFTSAILVIAIALVVYALRYIIEQLPSKNLRERQKAGATDADVIVNCVASLFVAGFIFTTIWWGAGIHYSSSITGSTTGSSSILYVLSSLGTYIIAYVIYGGLRWKRGIPLDTNGGSILAALVSSIAGGILLWFCSLSWGVGRDHSDLSFFVTFATPAFIGTFLVQATIFVAFSNKRTPDADREWYARLGGWLLISSIGWIVANSIVLYGVEISQALFTTIYEGKLSSLYDFIAWIAPFATVLTTVLALAGGYSSSASAESSRKLVGRQKIFQLSIQFASIATLLVIMITISYISAVVLSKIEIWRFAVDNPISSDPASDWIGIGTSIPQFRHIDNVKLLSTVYIGIWIAFFTAIGTTVACFVNINIFSLHGAYRDRLVRAYLGASNSYRKADSFTGFSEKDNRQLHRLKFQHPLHVLNATLNLVQSSNLAWQSRKSASFIFTPLFCGSWSFGYRRTNEYSLVSNDQGCKSLRYCNQSSKKCEMLSECLSNKSIRLGTAMAISGAAANPNMGHYSSPVVTFLMGIFNIRLGWWLGNTGKAGGGKDFWRNVYAKKARYFYQRSAPAFAMLPLINEVLGRTSEDKRYINVTDGGHFENLAIYEMVLRRNRLILVSDAAADANFKFSEISNAIEKCRVDLGVEIRFRNKLNIPSRNAPEDVRIKGQRYAIADIFYPEKNGHGQRKRGYLIYLRPTLSGREPIEIQHYAASNPSFPHQSTGDQFFDETQFEAYRELGLITMDEVLGASDVKDIVSRFA